MANDIKVPSFVNYTDLREKKELAQIEVEQIKNYAKSLNGKALEVLLGEIPDIELVTEINRRLIERKQKIEGVCRWIGIE